MQHDGGSFRLRSPGYRDAPGAFAARKRCHLNPALPEVCTAPEVVGPAWSPHSGRQKIRDGIWALSLANLCLANSWYVCLYTSPSMQYFRKYACTPPKLVAFVVNLLWISALIWVVLQAMRRARSRWVRPVCEWTFLLILLVELDVWRQIVLSVPFSEVLRWLKHPIGTVAALAFMACLVFRRRWVVRAAAVVVGILSPLVLMTLARIVYVAFIQDDIARQLSSPPSPALSSVRDGQPRVLWVIFDEADYRLAFEQRPASVRMPEFDRLRSECLSATHAVPPAQHTILSIPALLTGQRVTSAVPTDASHLQLTLADTNRVVFWNDLPSLFDSARELGLNTALVGWHHPYGRVLGRSLNYCAWHPNVVDQPVPALTFGAALFQEFESLLWNLHLRHQFRDLCETTLSESVGVATNTAYQVAFLHLGPPHKPGVFDARTGRFTLFKWSTVGGYLGNLALADSYLGKLRRAMQASGRWDKDWLIVSADHSWRWSQSYDGQRDPRVPFLIKAPGTNQPLVYSAEVNTLITHDLVLAMLRAELTNQQQVIPWLEARAPAPVHPIGANTPSHSATNEDP
jgi:hypothetical protein